ncbi:MAG: sigma-70 family RNA polymerase sigma factor [Planctomycetes bacterium]|nr:sigma-70 family RNA polymerase sigma factor [Planctomycetota bacterium]MCB9917279.1 sigma-70 family RNA polymerase sigma factor [Planctomycetota bacterium]
MPAPSEDPGAIRDDFVTNYEAVAPALCAWVLRHMSRTLRAKVENEDVLQEIWLRAFRLRDQFSGDTRAFRAWIFSIGKMVLLEVRRSTRRVQRVSYPEGDTARQHALHDVVDTMTRLTQRLVREESIARFLEYVATLPAEDQELLSFCGLEGMSCLEAGRKLGIGNDAATKRWQRLRTRLRERGLSHDWVA